MYDTPRLLSRDFDAPTHVHPSTGLNSRPNTPYTSADIGIREEQRKPVVRILNSVLADEFLLYVKSRRFHWNVGRTGVLRSCTSSSRSTTSSWVR